MILLGPFLNSLKSKENWTIHILFIVLIMGKKNLNCEIIVILNMCVLARYHLGQHRAYPGKCTNMEEDIK
jgi:hypothetical protein